MRVQDVLQALQEVLQALPHAQSRMTTLSDFAPLAGFLVSGMMPVNEASFAGNKLDAEKQKEYLQFALWRLEALRTWERDNLFAELKLLADQMGIKIKDALAPVFVAIAGTTASFSVVDSMQIIGPDMSRARIRHALLVTSSEAFDGLWSVLDAPARDALRQRPAVASSPRLAVQLASLGFQAIVPAPGAAPGALLDALAADVARGRFR